MHVAQWLEHLSGHQNVTGCTDYCTEYRTIGAVFIPGRGSSVFE